MGKRSQGKIVGLRGTNWSSIEALIEDIKTDQRVAEVALWGSAARGKKDPTDLDIAIGYYRQLVPDLKTAKQLSDRYENDMVLYSGQWKFLDSGWYLVPHSSEEGDFPKEFKILWRRHS